MHVIISEDKMKTSFHIIQIQPHLKSPGIGLKLHHLAIEHHVHHKPWEETHQGQVLRRRREGWGVSSLPSQYVSV